MPAGRECGAGNRGVPRSRRPACAIAGPISRRAPALAPPRDRAVRRQGDPKGTVIGREQGYVRERFYAWFTWREFDRFERALQRKVTELCTLEQDGFFAPRDFDLLPTCWYINHSCSGNVGFDRSENSSAIRKIRSGEELTYDYGLVETSPRVRWRCGCGSKQCRGVVTGNDWQDPEFQKRNGKYFHPYVRRPCVRRAGSPATSPPAAARAASARPSSRATARACRRGT